MRAKLTGMKNETKGIQWLWRYLFYIMAMTLIALGIILNTKADLGVSPIISVAYSVSIIGNWNFGNITLILYIVFVIAEFVLKGKNCKLFDLLQIVVSIIFTRVINFFDSYINLQLDNLWQKLIVLFFAILFTGIGAAVSVNMRIVPNPGDGIVAAVADKIHKKMGITKNIFDIGCIIVSGALGLIFRGKFVGIGIGTVLAMIFVGRVVALVNHFMLIPMANITGMGVPHQYLDITQLEELEKDKVSGQ
jgi:uncharacterized membrane protein YczE